MRVFQINTVYGSGSTGKIVMDLGQELETQGHLCHIAYGRGNKVNEKYLYKIGNKLSIYRHALLTRLTDRHGWYSKGATMKLVDQIKRFEPDVIQLHNLHGYYLNISILCQFLKQYGRPVVWVLHDCWAMTGHCTHFDNVHCKKWKKQCNRCPLVREYPKSLFTDHSKENFKRKKRLFTQIQDMIIVTPSIWLKNIVEQSFLQNYPVKVISNGLDLQIFRPTKSKIRKQFGCQNKFVILGVANIWDERKGLKSFHLLSQKLSDLYVIILIGLTKKQIRELPENVMGFTKTKTQKELAMFYTMADVYLNLSVEETMGMTTVESMACGTPAIVYNCTALPEFVPAECGHIVKKNHLKEVTSKLEDMRVNHRDYKADCIQYVKKYEKHAVYQQYINLYSEIGREKIIYELK